MNTSVFRGPTRRRRSCEYAGCRRKLHHWAVDETDRCFDDLYNLVHDPAFLTVAWERVRTNKGARSAGTDGIAPRSLGPVGGGRTASAAPSRSSRSGCSGRIRCGR